jgi:hypothetical protein
MKSYLLSAAILIATPAPALAQESYGTIVQYLSTPMPVFREDRSRAEGKNLLPPPPTKIVKMTASGAYGVIGTDNTLYFVRAMDVVAKDVRPPCANGTVAARPSGAVMAGTTMGSGSAVDCKLRP